MSRDYVPIFFDWLEVTQDLSPEEKGNLIDAVIAYASGQDYEQLLTGGSKIAFRFFKGQVDRNVAISDARSKAGSSKGEQTETNDIKPEQNETKENKPEQNISNFPKEKEKENNKDNKKEKDTEKERRFDLFWAAYPRKEAKPTAKKQFFKIDPDDELLNTMLTAIEKWSKTEQWSDVRYIPHPATWLNQERWKDDPPKAEVKPIPSPQRKLPAQAYEQRDYSSGEPDPDDVLDFLRGSA